MYASGSPQNSDNDGGDSSSDNSDESDNDSSMDNNDDESDTWSMEKSNNALNPPSSGPTGTNDALNPTGGARIGATVEEAVADPPVEEAVVDQTTVEKIGNNGVDDDHDGLTDCADPDLAITPSCSEWGPPLDDTTTHKVPEK